MPPVVALVGKSGSGKTVLMERLIAEFKGRGYRVAAVKHAAGGIKIDQAGKDSWRLTQAGSDVVLISSADKLVLIKKVERDPDIEEILAVLGAEFDLVLVEGFKRARIPKIEVLGRKSGNSLLCSPEELRAVVSDEPLALSLPQFARGDVVTIANFIEKDLGLKKEAGAFSSSAGN